MKSTSAANPARFYWMRYASDRATTVKTKKGDRKIVKGDLFGVRELRGKEVDRVLLQDGTVFDLAIPKSEILMNRSKEFRGKVKMLAEKKAPALPAKVVKKELPKSNHPNARRFKRLMYENGGATFGAFRAVLKLLKTDAERLELKRWALSVVVRGSALHQKINDYQIGAKSTGIKVVLAPKLQKKRITKIKVVKKAGSPVSVKLSELELPHEDDFTDHDLPFEFQKQFARVESSGGWLNFVSEADDRIGLMPGVAEDFNDVVRKMIEPHVRNARGAIDQAVNTAAPKLKAWALVHLQQAQQLGKRTELFEKLLNNPHAAVKQIVHVMLGIKSAKQSTPQDKKLDDLLSGITL